MPLQKWKLKIFSSVSVHAFLGKNDGREIQLVRTSNCYLTFIWVISFVEGNFEHIPPR